MTICHLIVTFNETFSFSCKINDTLSFNCHLNRKNFANFIAGMYMSVCCFSNRGGQQRSRCCFSNTLISARACTEKNRSLKVKVFIYFQHSVSNVSDQSQHVSQLVVKGLNSDPELYGPRTNHRIHSLKKTMQNNHSMRKSIFYATKSLTDASYCIQSIYT